MNTYLRFLQGIAAGLAISLLCACGAGAKGPDNAACATKPAQGDGMLRVAWRLQSQENVYGFNVLRADTNQGPWVRVNKEVIPGHGSTGVMHEYQYFDEGLTIGQTYYYQVEEITFDGRTDKITDSMAGKAKPRAYYEEKLKQARQNEAKSDAP